MTGPRGRVQIIEVGREVILDQVGAGRDIRNLVECVFVDGS